MILANYHIGPNSAPNVEVNLSDVLDVYKLNSV